MLELWIADKRFSSWSLRPWLLMKVLNIRFTEKLVGFELSDREGDKFKGISPSGLLPCLKFGREDIWDSLAIIEFIGDLYPEIWPSNSVAKAWSRSVMAEMHSGFSALRQACPMDCHLENGPFVRTPAVDRDIWRINEIWEMGLDRFGGPWLAGDSFGPVDAYFAPILLRANSYNIQFTQRCNGWINRMLAMKHLSQWINES
ncbi:glutathione S-transferase [Escherichia coli]|nr:glutathione S-transferase [Escherichia coli]EFU6042120.1 glutathione S-transferase [Escherichia coli]EGH9464749.1 glutathione S-transferase [Escherichia coli]EGK8619596.1 glutathione S-transferase [Escherichia coli]EGN2330562.1 glutathione S-transferase [Escherichia coli]